MSEVIKLTVNSEPLIYLANKDKRLAKLFSMVGGITYKPYEDSYRFLLETIIGQMLSNKVANILCERLLQLCDGQITPSTISVLRTDDFRQIGVSKPKASYIFSLTEAVLNDIIDFPAFNSMENQEVIKELTALRGIGSWSAKMYLIFVLNRPDVLPFEDGAFLQSYMWLYKTEDTTSKAVTAKCRKWKPYTSFAARYLYRALDNGLTKKPFQLYK